MGGVTLYLAVPMANHILRSKLGQRGLNVIKQACTQQQGIHSNKKTKKNAQRKLG